MKRNIFTSYLFYPIYILMAVFLFDKLLLLSCVTERTVSWQKVEPPFYESRRSLFQQLAAEGQDTKIGLIMGSSRSAEFPHDLFDKEIPNLRTYNFSAPFAPISFHYYWLTKILDQGIVPEFIVLEADPLILSKDAVGYSLSYSYDPSFVFANTDFYGKTKPKDVWSTEGNGFDFDEAETFFLKYLFAVYKYPPDFKAISDNAKAVAPSSRGILTGIQFRQYVLEIIELANRQKLGGIPNLLKTSLPPALLEKDADDFFRNHMSDPKPSGTQVVFYKKLLRLAAKKSIPVLLYKPVVSDPFEKRLEQIGGQSFKDSSAKVVNSLYADFPNARIKYVDLQNDARLHCRDFVDSYHLSGACFHEIVPLLMQDLRGL